MRRRGPRPAASGPRARRGPGERGFTFVELIVVIAVIGLMASIVVSSLDGLSNNTQVSAAARQLGNDLMRTQNIAQVHGRELFVEIDVTNSRWRVKDPPSPNDVPDPSDREEETFYSSWYEPPEGVKLASIALGSGESIDSSMFVVGFDGNGELSPSGFVAYFFHEESKKPDETGVSVEVSGLTALVNYHKGQIESEEVRRPEDF